MARRAWSTSHRAGVVGIVTEPQVITASASELDAETRALILATGLPLYDIDLAAARARFWWAMVTLVAPAIALALLGYPVIAVALLVIRTVLRLFFSWREEERKREMFLAAFGDTEAKP